MQKVTLNLSLENMMILKSCLEDSISEEEDKFDAWREYRDLPASAVLNLQQKKNILSSVESAIFHAEMPEE